MKIPVVLIFILLFTAKASAQIERKPTEIAKADTEISITAVAPGDKKSRKDLMKELALSPEQKAKLRELRTAHTAAKTAVENNASFSDMEKKKKIRELNKDQAAKLLAILTPEQREKFKESRQNNP